MARQADPEDVELAREIYEAGGNRFDIAENTGKSTSWASWRMREFRREDEAAGKPRVKTTPRVKESSGG